MSDAIILVVDDEYNIRSLLRMYLEQSNFVVEGIADGERALQRLKRPPLPALIILDLMLPGIDGWEVCRHVRNSSSPDIPILMLTARDEDVDKIVGLQLGADDYVTKPFNPQEIVARVKAILRRTCREAAPKTTVLQVGDLSLDRQRREVHLQQQSLQLRRKEFDLLATLMHQKEIVLTREQLLDQVWGYEFSGQTRTVDVHIAALRRKLKSSGPRIETVTGVGYRLTEKE